MAVITISPEAALRKQFIEKTINKKIEPLLPFLDKFPVVDLNGASTFKYFTDDNSAEDDIQAGKMDAPANITELGDLTKITVTPIQKQIGDTAKFGASLEFSDDVTNENGFVDEILRAIERTTYMMARKINVDHINAMLEFAAAPSISLKDGSWEDSSAIGDDIISMQESIDQEGYTYDLTNLYVAKKQYYQTKRFYTSLDGKFNPKDVEGSTMENIKSWIPAGTLIGMDANIKPLTTYKNINKKYSTSPKTSLVNVNRYTQEKWPYKEVVDIWCEMGIAVKHPRAILKQTGL